MKQRLGMLAAIALFCGATIFAPPASAQSTAGCVGFSGRWATTWPGGTTKMRIFGTKGAYAYRGGTLTGHVHGRVFAGSYAENDGSTGTFRFVLSSDENAFDGWFAMAGQPDHHYYWRGICTGSNAAR